MSVQNPLFGYMGGEHTSVDAAECKTNKAIRRILHELRGDFLGQLNRLLGDSRSTDLHDVGTDVTTCSRAIGVLDGPGVAG